MSSYIIPVVISGVVAVASWLALNFWMKPLMRYIELKSEIKADLVTYGNALELPLISDERQINRRQERKDRNRNHEFQRFKFDLC